jgi:hypothetical protein
MTKQYIAQNTKHSRMSKKKTVVDKIADKAVEITEKAPKIAMEEPFIPTKKSKQIKTLGDATFCSACSSNTKYTGECAVCGIPSEENRLRFMGELNFLKQKYPQYCGHIK